MGAILRRQSIDPRLRELESAAYQDMHSDGLPAKVARSMEVAAAAKLKAVAAKARHQARTIQTLQAIAGRRQWTRACWMCRAEAACPHREDALVSVWQGETRNA